MNKNKETRFFVASHCIIRSTVGNKNGKFLITLRSSDNDFMPNTWDIPGGTIEAGETAMSALHREISEETGLELKDKDVGVDYVFTNLESRPGTQYFVLVFKCNHDEEIHTIHLDGEHSEYAFVDYDEALKMNLIPFLREYILYKKSMIESKV